MARKASRCTLSEAEEPIENLARTITCPICGAEPQESCHDGVTVQGRRKLMAGAHTGRLKLARAQS